MALTYTAPFAQAPKTASAVVTTASVDLATTPTHTVLLATAGADGALLTRLSAIPRATVTASSLLLWISYGEGALSLVDSALMAAHTVAATTAIPVTAFARYSEDTPLRLQANAKLHVGSAVTLADGIVFTAELTDF